MKILAICGSTRKISSNLNLIHAIQKIAAANFQIEIYEGLAGLPMFNPDLETGIEPSPEIRQSLSRVEEFRAKLKSADAVLICTPEYAVGVPGALKNAIDWTVGSMEFSNKPVALITASTAGFHGHRSLLGTLLIIEAKMTAATALLVSGIKSKLAGSEIRDEKLLRSIAALLETLSALVRGDVPESDLLRPPSATE